MIKEVIFNYLLLNISCHNFWMSSKKIQFLTGGQEHQRGEVLTTFGLGLKGTNPSKEKWMGVAKGEGVIPSSTELVIKSFGA